MDLVRVLLAVSERAANVARCCRSHEHLIELLVQEKKGTEKNPRFVQDFKTLADVLIQETVRHIVGHQFPELKGQIYGEESAIFTNTLGESIEVCIQEDEEATAKMLFKVLDNDVQAAEVLAHEVHREVCITDIHVERLPDESLNSLAWDIKNFGVWIDPIDSTAEYIAGETATDNQEDIATGGLQCVTVLIGVFDQTSGAPVIGVVNQPFHQKNSDGWTGHAYWGVHWNNFSIHSVPPSINRDNEVVMVSGSEKPELLLKLEDAGFTVRKPPGAGYKLLCVARGEAGVYILSKGTTFQWDTCAPHALLLSLNGGVVSFQSARSGGEAVQLKYNQGKADEACNKEGIVAFRDVTSLNKIARLLE